MKKLILYPIQCLFVLFFINGQLSAQDFYNSNPALVQNTKQSEEEFGNSVLNVNLAGFLQWGPIIQYEQRVAPKGYLVTNFRYNYLGLLAHAVWTGFDEDNAYNPGSFSLGFGYKTYFPTSKPGSSLYLMGIAELENDKVRNEKGRPYEYVSKTTSLGLYGNFGHRWKSESGFFVSLGGITGVALGLKTAEKGEDYYSVDEDRFIFPILMVDFSIGMEF